MHTECCKKHFSSFIRKKMNWCLFSKNDSLFKFAILLKLTVLYFSNDLILAIASGSLFSFFSYLFWFYLRCISI